MMAGGGEWSRQRVRQSQCRARQGQGWGRGDGGGPAVEVKEIVVVRLAEVAAKEAQKVVERHRLECLVE